MLRSVLRSTSTCPHPSQNAQGAASCDVQPEHLALPLLSAASVSCSALQAHTMQASGKPRTNIPSTERHSAACAGLSAAQELLLLSGSRQFSALGKKGWEVLSSCTAPASLQNHQHRHTCAQCQQPDMDTHLPRLSQPGWLTGALHSLEPDMGSTPPSAAASGHACCCTPSAAAGLGPANCPSQPPALPGAAASVLPLPCCWGLLPSTAGPEGLRAKGLLPRGLLPSVPAYLGLPAARTVEVICWEGGRAHRPMPVQSKTPSEDAASTHLRQPSPYSIDAV